MKRLFMILFMGIVFVAGCNNPENPREGENLDGSENAGGEINNNYYIADDSGNIDTALTYLDKIEQSINRLKEFPNSGTIPQYSVLKKQGYQVIIMEKYLIFYKVNERKKAVIIYAIVDGRREYKNLI